MVGELEFILVTRKMKYLKTNKIPNIFLTSKLLIKKNLQLNYINK
jgi:hypothetical protein